MPSILRIVGFVLAVLLILVASRRLRRRGAGSRVPAATILVIGLGLATVSVAPDLVRPIQGPDQGRTAVALRQPIVAVHRASVH